MQTLDDGFEESVDVVGACELEERAKDLWGAELGGLWGERGGVEVVDQRL